MDIQEQNKENDNNQQKDEKPKEYHEIITDEKELKALDDLKKSLTNITDEKDKAVLDPNVLLDNDLLIHFLRDKYLNINEVTKIIIEYCHWKAKMDLENLYSSYKFKEKNGLQLLFPHGFHKVTKDGHPIYIQILGMLNSEELFKLTTHEELIRYSIQINEKLERECCKACSELKGAYVHGVFEIVDFNGISRSLLSRKFLAYLKETFKISQDYYPDFLTECYVLNANLLFRAFYSTIKIFLDSKTKNKMQVFGRDYKSYLLEKIDSKNLPKLFGGECECPGGCLFSNAGPWKKTEEEEEKIPEDILKKRDEVTKIVLTGNQS